MQKIFRMKNGSTFQNKSLQFGNVTNIVCIDCRMTGTKYNTSARSPTYSAHQLIEPIKFSNINQSSYFYYGI